MKFEREIRKKATIRGSERRWEDNIKMSVNEIKIDQSSLDSNGLVYGELAGLITFDTIKTEKYSTMSVTLSFSEGLAVKRV